MSDTIEISDSTRERDEVTVKDVEYPDNMGDATEIMDLIVRKGPMSYRDIMQQTSVYSGDQVFDWLMDLQSAGLVDCTSGDLEEHGTTADVYYITERALKS